MTTKSPRTLPHRSTDSRLVYASGPDGAMLARHLRTGESRLERDITDSGLIGVAHELADSLKEQYAARFIEKLEERDYPDPLPAKIGAALMRRLWHEPRITLYSGEECNERIADDPDVYKAQNDSVVINFRLPVPLEAFWHKRIPYDSDDLPEVASGWGDRYYNLLDTPWDTIREWRQQHPDFHVHRLNGTGRHKDGADGYYYLIAVSRRDEAVMAA